MRAGNDSDSQSPRDVGRDESLARVEIALLGIIFLSAAFLNGALLLVLWRQRKHVSRMRVFVFHLCVADLVVAFFQVCPQLMWDITDRFVGPDLVCRLVKYLQVLGMFSSTYMIVVMTVDRYQAVCNPMVTFQRRRARHNIPVCVAWGVSAVGSLPQIFIFSQVEVAPGVFDCWAKFIQPWGLKTYITWTTLVIFAVPVFIVVFCQVRICRAIRINLSPDARRGSGWALPLPSRASGAASMSRARVKTLKMTVVIVLAYILCWAPFFTVQLWSAWDTNAPKENATFAILMLLASLNSCANPCIYLLFSGQLPKKLVSVLCQRQAEGKLLPQEDTQGDMQGYMQGDMQGDTGVSILYTSFRNVSNCK